MDFGVQQQVTGIIRKSTARCTRNTYLICKTYSDINYFCVKYDKDL